MKKKYDISVMIGRFQPWHNQHAALDRFAQSIAEKQVILLGSSFAARSPKNPFTWEERRDLIWSTKTLEEHDNCAIKPIRDYPYSDSLWVAQVHGAVELAAAKFGIQRPRVCLVGYEKDASSYYLKLFDDQWRFESPETTVPLDATTIRNFWLHQNLGAAKDLISPEVFGEIKAWSSKHADIYGRLMDEKAYYAAYPGEWGEGPHVTTDAVLTCGGYVLLIQRGQTPGKGLFALPGGFLGLNERLEDGMIRELREETSLKVPGAVLKGSIRGSRVFDHPNRSLRGRVITHAYHMQLWDEKLPRVKGRSDARKAEWRSISWCLQHPELFFEDHYQILECMISGGSK